MTWLSGTSRLQFSRLSTYDLQTLNYSGDERKPSRSYVQSVLFTLFTYYIISFQLPRNIVVCLTKGFRLILPQPFRRRLQHSRI